MRTLIVLFVTFVLAHAQDAPKPRDWQEWLDRGVGFYQSARYPEAVAAFQQAVELNPTEVTSRLYLATAYMSQYIPGAVSPENSEIARKAEEEFLRVLQSDPENKTAVLSLASLKYQQAQGVPDLEPKLVKLDEAKAWYEKLTAIDPGEKTAYYSIGVIDWVKWYDNWLRARSDLGMQPRDKGPLPDPAVRERLKQQFSAIIDNGISSLRKALEIDPSYDDAMAYMNLLIRERADLCDTREEYERETAVADQWLQSALDAKRMKAGQAARSAEPAPTRIRVGAKVQEANLIRRVEPVRPDDTRVQGTVRLTVIIDTDGRVRNVQLISGPPLLVGAAINAVQQWEYRPTLLNAQPVEVVTQVDVDFPPAR